MLKSRIVDIAFFTVVFIVVVSDVFGEVSRWLYVVPVLFYVALHIYGSTFLQAGFFVPVKFRAESAGNFVALTFDDGPVPGKTERLLDILKERRIPAAFFCIGHRLKANPLLAKRMHAEGHLLGNHSYWHGRTFDLQPAAKIAKELDDTDSVITESIGEVPRFFRPPYGVTNPMVAAALRKTNHITIGWSVRSFDTVIRDRAKLMTRVTSQLKAGDIVLFHDYSESMLEILPSLLDHIDKTGLKIVRVDELLNERAYE